MNGRFMLGVDKGHLEVLGPEPYAHLSEACWTHVSSSLLDLFLHRQQAKGESGVHRYGLPSLMAHPANLANNLVMTQSKDLALVSYGSSQTGCCVFGFYVIGANASDSTYP